MSGQSHEAQVLQRAGARAIRHYLLLLCVPPAGAFPLVALSGVVERFQTDRSTAALALLLVASVLTLALWRGLWRAFRR